MAAAAMDVDDGCAKQKNEAADGFDKKSGAEPYVVISESAVGRWVDLAIPRVVAQRRLRKRCDRLRLRRSD